jgi:hypothetical protein
VPLLAFLPELNLNEMRLLQLMSRRTKKLAVALTNLGSITERLLPAVLPQIKIARLPILDLPRPQLRSL